MKIVLLIFALFALVLSASAYDSVCNGRGIFQNKRCQCHPDYIGARCQTRICNRGSSLEVACNVQGGICDSISYPARCLCKPDFQGNDCSVRSIANLDTTLQGDYTGTVDIFPISITNTSGVLGVACQTGCTGYTLTLQSFKVEATKITAISAPIAESKSDSSNCTALPSLTVELSSASVNTTTGIFSGTVVLKSGDTTVVTKANSQIKFSGSAPLLLAYDLANPSSPQATTVMPKETGCLSTRQYTRFSVTKAATPSSGSALSASLFMFLSVLASILAFL